jgi:aminopeptidase-like protein
MSGPLQALGSPEGAARAGERALALAAELAPMMRSLTGAGVRETFARLGRIAPLQVHEVPSGTPVLDWEVPPEWRVREAYVADATGRRLIDVAAHPLHLVGYSRPVRTRLGLEELRPHLHTDPRHPDWIPYRTSYYRDAWGFCLAQSELERWGPGPYEVVVDTELLPGSLSYAECRVAGQGAEDFVLYTHSCHPGMANDNASGLAVAAVIAAALAESRPRLGYRVVFAPGTIGSITWLARNEDAWPRIRGGLVLGLLGDAAALTYKRSRQNRSETDLIAAAVVRELHPEARVLDFEPYGYDERQFCSPGIDLAVGRLSRSVNNGYNEYHSSGDDLSVISASALAGSIAAVAQIVNRLDGNPRYRSLAPRGEPRLGKRGLFRSTGGTDPSRFEHALLWVLNMADGRHGLYDTAAAAGLTPHEVQAAASALHGAGLIEIDA